MKIKMTQAIAIFTMAAMLWCNACSLVSAMTQLQKYAPIGIAAFDGTINIISPAPGSPLQLDKALVDGLWVTLSTAIMNYQAAPAASKQGLLNEVTAALTAAEDGVNKTLQDFGASGAVEEAVSLSLVLIVTTLSSIEAQLAPAPVTGKKAALAPQTGIVKGHRIKITGKVGDFKSTYNAIMKAGNHVDHQLQ